MHNSIATLNNYTQQLIARVLDSELERKETDVPATANWRDPQVMLTGLQRNELNRTGTCETQKSSLLSCKNK